MLTRYMKLLHIRMVELWKVIWNLSFTIGNVKQKQVSVDDNPLFFNLNSAGDHRSLGGPGRGSSGWSEEFICVCIRCESKEEFKGITNFSEHMLTFHLDVGIVCPVCDKQPFNSKKLLKTHLILHTDRKACCPVSIFYMVDLQMRSFPLTWSIN